MYAFGYDGTTVTLSERAIERLWNIVDGDGSHVKVPCAGVYLAYVASKHGKPFSRTDVQLDLGYLVPTAKTSITRHLRILAKAGLIERDVVGSAHEGDRRLKISVVESPDCVVG